MLKFLKSKFLFLFNIGVYCHRFVDACNDLRYELYNVKSGLISWGEFIQQIIPTMKYHLSGEFQKRIAEIFKEEHLGLDGE